MKEAKRYVLKTGHCKSGDPTEKKPFELVDVLSEKIAADLYSLFVRVPKTHIVALSQPGTYGIASEVIPGYKDLAEYVSETEDSYSFPQRDKVKGREGLLVAAAFLNDVDVIGAFFRNAGVVPAPNQTIEICKIDPGCADLDSVFELEQIGEEHIYINRILSMAMLVGGNSILATVFSKLNIEVLNQCLQQLFKISNEELQHIIVKDEYCQLFENPDQGKIMLEKWCGNLIKRRQLFAIKFQKLLWQSMTSTKSQTVAKTDKIYPHYRFFTTRISEYGASKPAFTIKLKLKLIRSWIQSCSNEAWKDLILSKIESYKEGNKEQLKDAFEKVYLIRRLLPESIRETIEEIATFKNPCDSQEMAQSFTESTLAV